MFMSNCGNSSGFSGIMETGDHPRKHRKEVLPMEKSLLLKLTILLTIIATLSGCIWVEPIGYRPGGRDHGGHHRGRN
jgi:hypothetical protein